MNKRSRCRNRKEGRDERPAPRPVSPGASAKTSDLGSPRNRDPSRGEELLGLSAIRVSFTCRPRVSYLYLSIPCVGGLCVLELS
jgi:hypothetical protein